MAARDPAAPALHPTHFEIRRKAIQLCLEESFPAKRVTRREQPAPGGTGGQGESRRAQASSSRLGHPEDQPIPTTGAVSAGEPGDSSLHEQQLLKKRKPKPPRNPPRPRFFERATPNQMWQTDIFTFRLGGKNGHLIGFMDDFSRNMVRADIFRSQTAEHVLEVYRTAVAEYGVPKEMLSDQGRQYSSWRGTTHFETELRKDRVHHTKRRPHHPMTLGKIERFWKTIWEEFLGRAQFDSFESARERIRLWVKHYHHQRPTTGGPLSQPEVQEGQLLRPFPEWQTVDGISMGIGNSE